MSATLHKLKYTLKAKLLKLFYFRTEQQLLRGTFQGPTDLPPVILLTVHKAASSLLSIRLGDFFRQKGFAVADLSTYFAKTGLDQRAEFVRSASLRRNAFCAPGVFHCAVRWEVEIPCMDKMKVLLVLRDPRDVLVSHYFSTLYSHPVINPEFFDLKEQAKSMTIDQYVQFIAPQFRKRYEHYRMMISTHQVLFLKYEDLILRPADFEKQLGEYLNIPVKAGEIVRESDFQIDTENPSAHKRQVKAGDHRSKLKPETIQWLNDFFIEDIRALGYASL